MNPETQAPADAQADVQEMPVTVPGVRLLLVNNQPIDIPLVSTVGELGAPGYEEMSLRLQTQTVLSFPNSKISVRCENVILLTMIEMQVVTQEQADAAQASQPAPGATMINVPADATYDQALAAVADQLGAAGGEHY